MAIQFTHGKPGFYMTFSTAHRDASDAARKAVRFSRSVTIGNQRFTETEPLRALENHWQQVYGIGQMESSKEIRAYRDCIHRMCNALHGGLHSGKSPAKTEKAFQSGA